MNAPAYNPAAGGPAAIDAQPPSGERERVVTALNDAAHDLEQGRLTWITSTSLRAAADMLAADANIRAIGPNVTTGELFSDWYDALPYGEPSYQETFQAGFEHGAVAQQVAVPQGFAAWEYQNAHGDKFLTFNDPSNWHDHDKQGFKRFRGLQYAAPEPAGSTNDLTVAYMCGVAHGKESAAERQLKALAAFGELQNQLPQARELSDAASDVLSERQRQVSVEGWTPEHDDEHNHCELGRAAACYAVGSTWGGHWPDGWDFKDAGGPQMGPGHRRNLVKAAALLVAEIERLDRAVLAARSEK